MDDFKELPKEIYLKDQYGYCAITTDFYIKDNHFYGKVKSIPKWSTINKEVFYISVYISSFFKVDKENFIIIDNAQNLINFYTGEINELGGTNEHSI